MKLTIEELVRAAERGGGRGRFTFDRVLEPDECDLVQRLVDAFACCPTGYVQPAFGCDRQAWPAGKQMRAFKPGHWRGIIMWLSVAKDEVFDSGESYPTRFACDPPTVGTGFSVDDAAIAADGVFEIRRWTLKHEAPPS